MKTIAQEIRPILEDLKSELQKIYKERLKNLILYGSYAREEATIDSDIDVIAVIEDIKNPMIELGRLSSVISLISLKYDTLISLYPVRPEDFENRDSPLLMNARKEGVYL